MSRHRRQRLKRMRGWILVTHEDGPAWWVLRPRMVSGIPWPVGDNAFPAWTGAP